MSVVTKNMFALLDDEDGPKPAAAANTKAAPGGAGANEKKAGDNKRTAAGGGGPAARSGRYPGRGGGAKPSARPENVNEDASEAPKRFDGEKARRGGTRGRGEGRGDGRGRGRGRGGPRGDRPDRHSATGLVDSDKKLHQGWGGDTGDGEQLAEAQGAADAAAATGDWSGAPAGESSGWDAPAGEATNADGTAPAPANEESEARKAYRERRQKEDEEDESLVTFDEYRKTRNSGLDALVPALEGRKVEADESAPKGATKLVKDEDEANYFVGGKTKSNAGRARAPKEKQLIEIDARFDRPNRGGGERGGGGRGGPRGRGEGRGDYRGAGRGGPRGAPRGGPPRSSGPQKEVNVDDANAFPSLS
jgi:plasminogen activator inhibitor 1 RNA-binding protein